MGCVDAILCAVPREIGPWPWDVAAGVIIAQEAGGLVTGSHEVFDSSKDTITFGEVGEEILTSRKYLVIRPIGDSEVCSCTMLSLDISFISLYRTRQVEKLRSESSPSSMRPSLTMTRFRVSVHAASQPSGHVRCICRTRCSCRIVPIKLVPIESVILSIQSSTKLSY